MDIFAGIDAADSRPVIASLSASSVQDGPVITYAVTVSAPKVVAMDIVFIVDVSGSADPKAIAAFQRILAEPIPARVCVITFNDSAQLLLPLQPFADANIPAVQRALDRVKLTGGTNISAALLFGMRQFKGSRRAMILYTDGVPTVGPEILTPPACPLYVCGCGDTLSYLSPKFSQEEDVFTALSECLMDCLSPRLTDIHITLEGAECSIIKVIFGEPLYVNDHLVIAKIPPVCQGGSRTLLVQCHAHPRPSSMVTMVNYFDCVLNAQSTVLTTFTHKENDRIVNVLLLRHRVDQLLDDLCFEKLQEVKDDLRPYLGVPGLSVQAAAVMAMLKGVAPPSIKIDRSPEPVLTVGCYAQEIF